MREELHFLPSSSYLLLCPRKCATLCCWRRLKGWPGQIKDEELAYRDRILAAAKLMRCKFKAEKGFDIFFLDGAPPVREGSDYVSVCVVRTRLQMRHQIAVRIYSATSHCPGLEGG